MDVLREFLSHILLIQTPMHTTKGTSHQIQEHITRLPYIGNLILIRRAIEDSRTNSYVMEAKGNSAPFAWLQVSGNFVNPWLDCDIAWLPKLDFLEM